MECIPRCNLTEWLLHYFDYNKVYIHSVAFHTYVVTQLFMSSDFSQRFCYSMNMAIQFIANGQS